MTRLIVIGMAGAVLIILTGCVDDREFRSLKDSYALLYNEVNYLKTRVAAIEKACLQINARLTDSESRGRAADQSLVSKPAPASRTDAKHLSLVPDPTSSSELTRDSFSRRLMGLTLSEAVAILGKPDKVTEDAGIQSWTYNAVRLATKSGPPELSPALIVFEQGYISRAVLTGNIQYSSEPKEKEPESTAADSNIAANAISTVDTNK